MIKGYLKFLKGNSFPFNVIKKLTANYYVNMYSQQVRSQIKYLINKRYFIYNKCKYF